MTSENKQIEAPAAVAVAVAVADEREAFEQAFIAEKLRVMGIGDAALAVQAIRMCHLNRYGNGDYPSLEAYSAWFAWQSRAALAAAQAEVQAATHQEIANEELMQLGYTFKDGRLIPPDHVGELMAVVQSSSCGCRVGECETKSNRACRMTAEIRGQVNPTDALLQHALELAFDHLEMDSLRVSHCKDAAVIDSAMRRIRASRPADAEMQQAKEA